LDEQKNNLLNGIKDSSCNYCWNGNEELRRIKLDHWDNTFNVRSLELNIGNTCNLTCVYCGPKYSSKWAKDLKDGEYPIFTDNEQYKNAGITQSMYNVDDLVKLYNLINPTEQLKFVGGEPIITPLVHDVLDKINISEKEIHFPTSLIYEQSILKQLISKVKNNSLSFGISLDCRNQDLAEFIRYGFKWDIFEENLMYLLNETDSKIAFETLVTAHTIWNLEQMFTFVNNLYNKYPDRISWNVSVCITPVMHSFVILSPNEKEKAISIVESVMKQSIFKTAKLGDVLQYLDNNVFSQTIKTEQSEFIKEFASRRNVNIPQEILFLL